MLKSSEVLPLEQSQIMKGLAAGQKLRTRKIQGHSICGCYNLSLGFSEWSKMSYCQIFKSKITILS